MDKKYKRRSRRLRGYDYASVGAYFVTICTYGKLCLFGQINNKIMMLNDAGKIVRDEWLETEIKRPNITLDAFVVMPNHMHGIIIINENRGKNHDENHDENPGRGVLQYAPTTYVPTPRKFRSPSQTIGSIVRGFKSAVTKNINILRHTPGNIIWQRNYYDHIIRNEMDLIRIRRYIQNNPADWEQDKHYV